jgi:hypothetical protein
MKNSQREAVVAAVVVVLVVLLAYKLWFQHSHWNSKTVEVCDEETKCDKFSVHREHHNPEEAAKLLGKVVEKNARFLEFMHSRYLDGGAGSGLDPTKNNGIDVIRGTEMYTDPNDPANRMATTLNREYLQERVRQLLNNYDKDKIHEISPLNREGNTSYTEDKVKLVLCLRKKESNENGEFDLHDENTVVFVVLHELSHMMNDGWKHGRDFWLLFKFMLLNAVDAGVYFPVDYSATPLKYCGLLLAYNPLFDASL